MTTEMATVPEANLASLLQAVEGLRRELKLTWEAHEREHEQHEKAHSREHQFAQDAIDKAALMAKENKADANEWRGSMTDREAKFATKEDTRAIMARLDNIERANILSDERDRSRSLTEAEGRLTKEKADAERERQLERRQSRQQWQVGIVVTFVVILVNLVIRLVTT